MTVRRDFKEPARCRPDLVIGREELVSDAREQLARGGSVLLHGPAGIGKSTVLRALAAENSGAPRTVLRCSATESESHLPFLALADLFGLVLDRVSPRLPAAQRTALESALTGRGESTLQRDGLALRLAVLSTLRALAAEGPVLVVADDLQWLDSASAELLGFAARRLGDTPVQLVCAVRTEGQEYDRHLRACPPDTLAVRLGPFSRTQVSALLDHRGYTGLSRSTVRDIHRTSGGNPLFALELGRALAESPARPRPGEPLPVPTSLRALVLSRLEMLSDEARRTLLVASAGARPTLALLHAAGRDDAEAETAQAAALGLLATDPEEPALRFAHPLISAALYAEAPAHERRAVHTALSTAASDPIERARHLALATTGTDPEVAARLAEAAALARDRGAPSVAASLGLLAARHTPADSVPGPDERRLRAAEDAITAGEADLARDIAREVLTRATVPTERVRAWMVVIEAAGQALGEVDAVFPQVLADAGDDPRLLALVHYQLAWREVVVDGDFAEARQEAAHAADLAARGADRRTELMALAFQASTETLMGHPDAPATIRRALQEPQDPDVACHHNGAAMARFRWLLMSDRLPEARTAVTALLREARRRGMVESEVHFLRMLADTELRSGHCGRALDLTRESLRLARDSGIGESASAMLASFAEASGGDVDRALALAREAADHAEVDGDQLYLSLALAALGYAQLVAGDAAAAVRSLRRVRELEHAMGISDPARGRWHGDLAEALVCVGEVGEAQELINVTRVHALRLDRASVLAVLDRAEALVRAARGEHQAAQAQLASAQDRLGKLGHGLEEARAAFALARLRARGPGPAAYDEAARLFRRCRALPWLRRVDETAAAGPARAETAPAATPAALDGLAAMERQVAALVMEGATNREIAGRLFISVKTVEATLTRVYRKLGIRSRVDIVRLAAGRRTP
ncbi:AAA family ATPase [Streptomyces griseomycini]|uniref:DNA-binding CsgD family transcriptional regulator/DNA polymerase III delta prime subunit n=1 Tax=Streptomyces griseomycini TaxID=66895 RepID=A0A7W7LYH0_9ACTN|nr:LuxR family transcriptional regulator [Streptomyces griseomycini]MBB4898815.1 DNA-binding CsgD family transcriptional regulator/DNA polymerase III delta prime subunit [Streptomyces griseomycini]GGQ04164.1 transcriptional regulator [Streptomyces griseomycini]GGR18395.1 transcriptional regulator [Streptomyces griseomycini]